jgi:Secretion system C-terminal sorting domain
LNLELFNLNQSKIMKQKALTMLLLSSSFLIQAQISLNTANAPAPGHAHQYRSLDSLYAARLNVGVAGASRTWDFSAAVVNATILPYWQIWRQPNASRFASRFAGTTVTGLAIEMGDTTVTCYKNDATGFYNLGDADDSITVRFTPSLRLMKYPFTYNTTFTDSTKLIISQLGNPVLDTLPFTQTTLVDAYGTVRTPIGNFDALRVKESATFTIELFGLPAQFNTVSYRWVTAQHSAGIFSQTRQVLSFFGQTDTSYSGEFIMRQTVGTEETTSEMTPSLKTYPNPTIDKVQLDFELEKTEKVAVILYNLAGQTITVVPSKSYNAGKNTLEVDLQSLPKGTYLILMHSESKKLGSQKVILH